MFTLEWIPWLNPIINQEIEEYTLGPATRDASGNPISKTKRTGNRALGNVADDFTAIAKRAAEIAKENK